jgi:hypothetical protein
VVAQGSVRAELSGLGRSTFKEQFVGLDLAAFGAEQAKLTAVELLAANKHNWRVEKADIKHALLEEYYAPGTAGSSYSTKGFFAVRLDLRLVDESKRSLLIRRRNADMTAHRNTSRHG